jgi:CelD/BcsL family acetyltransferase involved in cellulose biosynthesis
VTNHERAASLDALREDWTSLAERSRDIFSTWEWSSTWWNHFGGDHELAPLRLGDADGAFAIAPLYVERRGPLRILRFLGHGPGDVLGPVCAAADRGAAGEALTAALGDGAAGRWHALLAERIPIGPLGGALGGRVLQSEANPELETEGQSWDEYVASCSRNMREKLRRNTRKIERDHELRYELCEDAGQLDASLATLHRLHRLRWQGESSFERDAVVEFHRDFAAVALEKGWLRLWTMHIDGEAVAAWYGFRFAGVEAYYQSGRDPSYDRFSIGFLMLMRSIQGAFDDGLERYTFLRGDESYKGRFATLGDTIETRAVGNGLLLGAMVGAGATAIEWPWLRRRVAASMR